MNPTFRRSQSGVGMIEILITVLVLSIGLMGLAALQGFSLQSNQVAYHRTIATNIAYELLDHMRVNRRHVLQNGVLPGVQRWEQRASEQLPNGVLEWEVNGGDVNVSITWTDDRSRTLDGGDDGEEPDDPEWTLTVQSRI